MKIDHAKGFICLIYPIFALLWLLSIVFGGLNMEPVRAAILIIGAVSVMLPGYCTIKFTEDKIFGLYLLYNVLSGIWCIAFGMPPRVYVSELAVVVLPMILYYAGRGLEKKYISGFYRNFILSVLFLGILTVALYFCIPRLYTELHDDLWSGFSYISESFGERSESWIAAVNNMVNFWIGDGLGSHGLKAAEYQYYIVPDGGLVKLYAEMGLIGTSMILFIISLVYIKAIKGKPVPELAIITAAILMSIVCNVLYMEIFTPIIYFALGRAVRLLNDDRAGEEYVGPFENESDQDEEDSDLEGAPATKQYEEASGMSASAEDIPRTDRDLISEGGGA